MKLAGEQRISAPRDEVYRALNDPEILQRSIPGCQSLERISDTEMQARVGLKIGPVKATFKGAVTLSDLNPPESYTISGQGKGGAAGHAKGTARVRLEEAGDETVLHYSVNAQVGGKIAQLGARLIDATAKKLADQFFRKFGEIVGGAAVPADQVPAGQAPEAARPSSHAWMWWVAAALAAAFIALVVLS